MATKQKQRQKKAKPIAGGTRIHSLCPVPPRDITVDDAAVVGTWRVLMIEIDDEDPKNPMVVVENNGDAHFNLFDIACWALMVEESKEARYQEIWPCIPSDANIVEPVFPDDPRVVGIVSPSQNQDDIADMLEDYLEELDLPTVNLVEEDEEDEPNIDPDTDDGEEE